MREIAIGENDGGQRVDRFLRKLLPSATLGHLFKMLRKGAVKVNGRRTKPDARLEAGDTVTLFLDDARYGELSNQRGRRRSAPRSRSERSIDVLHEDEHVLAVDKPPMLIVQTGGSPGEPTLEELIRDRIGPTEGLTFKPSLAHRLDRGTSGVVLFGVSAAGLRGLTRAFREHRITKRYVALCAGPVDEDEFEVDAPLLRREAPEGQGARVRVSSHPDAQTAQTDVTVLARSADRRFTLVEARPRTGRTHQIRVHLRHRKLPIVGDPVYGLPSTNKAVREKAGLWRPFLHARSVTLQHPVETGRELTIESPVPEDLLRALDWAGVRRPAGAGATGATRASGRRAGRSARGGGR